MLRMAICDDDSNDIKSCYDIITTYLKNHTDFLVSVTCFSSAQELLAAINNQQTFNIYILDVIMPDINGIEMGKHIRDIDGNAVLIYLTNSSEYAVQSYSVQAYYYLMKPIEKNELYQILDNLFTQLMKGINQLVLINTKNCTYSINLKDIQIMENLARKHAIAYYLKDDRVLESITIQQSFSKTCKPYLENSQFLKIGASFVINMRFISSLTKNEIRMQNGIKIPVPQKIRVEVRRKYLDFALEWRRIQND